MLPEQVQFSNRVKLGDDFDLDRRAYELRRAGRPLKLERIPMELLLLLVERHGELVSREQIIERIWGQEVFLDADTSINSAIRKIRQALKDSPEQPRFVQTVTGRGYRFIAPVAEIAPPTLPVAEERIISVENQRSGAAINVATGPVQPPPPKQRGGQRKTLWAGSLAVAGFVLLLALGIGSRRGWSPLRTGTPALHSIAVLPLENITGDPAQQYFSDGMTDALITDLAQIGSLRVVSRTSTAHYRDAHKTLPEIAKELGVDAVVEGTIARSGNRVRIDAQLIEATTDRHLWARSYERDIQDVLALQSDLARTIASEVQVRLSPGEQARLETKPSVRPEAYEAYLKGRFFWNKRNKEAIEKSIEYFTEAINIDPNYAPAYAGLADAYNISACGVPGGFSVKDAGPKAKAAALKAIELDDSSAEAHTALGMAMSCYEGTRSEIEHEYRKAIALNPNYALAHHYYALLLLGWRNEEGLEQVREALRIDPVSPNLNGLYGEFLMETRQFDKGIAQFQKTVELDPHQYNSRVRLGFGYALAHRYNEAESEFREAEKISPNTLSSQAGLAYIYGLEGRRSEAEKMLPDLQSRSDRAGHPWLVCLVYIGLNRKQMALTWLEKAYSQGDFLFDLDNPLLDPLREEPAFQELVRRVKAAQKGQSPT
jgi:TolB-like protein/DNA-binding winged helix-turn-helix (wHTH) protein/Tfp pilus assembly protein PilF